MPGEISRPHEGPAGPEWDKARDAMDDLVQEYADMDALEQGCERVANSAASWLHHPNRVAWPSARSIRETIAADPGLRGWWEASCAVLAAQDDDQLDKAIVKLETALKRWTDG